MSQTQTTSTVEVEKAKAGEVVGTNPPAAGPHKAAAPDARFSVIDGIIQDLLKKQADKSPQPSGFLWIKTTV